MHNNRMQSEFEQKDDNKPVRLNKYLSEAGICSRREADRLIEMGKVLVDGQVAVTGQKVLPTQKVIVEGQRAEREKEMLLLAVNKPRGVLCSTDDRWGDTTIDAFLNCPKRVFPIGRLDKDSEGLLLLTNNGDIVNKMMRSGNMHEKEYIVTVNRPVTDSFLHGMANGVPLVELNTTTRKCRVERTGKKQFRIVLTQGLNRQIRRMCEYFGYRVQKLVRVRIMNIELGNLEPGKYRDVTSQEYKRLLELIASSSNAPVRPGKKQPQNERMRTNSDPRKETNRKNANTTKRSQNRLHGTFTVVNKNIDRERTHGSKKATD